MHTKKTSIVYAFISLVILIFIPSNYSFCQQLTVKRQTDGTMKIHSIPSEMKIRIAKMVYCRTIDELIKEEKDTLNRLVSDNRYEEVKDSLEIIEGLRQLKMQKCR